LRVLSLAGRIIALAATTVFLLAVLKVFTATWVVLAGSAIAGWCLNLVVLGLGERLRQAWERAAIPSTGVSSAFHQAPLSFRATF
jgi:hypothetical protein